jgi:hypothetical protein
VIMVLISRSGPPFQQHLFRTIPRVKMCGSHVDGDQLHQSQQRHQSVTKKHTKQLIEQHQTLVILELYVLYLGLQSINKSTRCIPSRWLFTIKCKEGFQLMQAEKTDKRNHDGCHYQKGRHNSTHAKVSQAHRGLSGYWSDLYKSSIAVDYTINWYRQQLSLGNPHAHKKHRKQANNIRFHGRNPPGNTHKPQTTQSAQLEPAHQRLNKCKSHQTQQQQTTVN